MSISKAPPAVRGGALDAFRFLAALFIVLYHAASTAPGAASLEAGALSRGYLATDFFLILSGYVLGRAYGAKLEAGQLSPGAFWLRRFLRVWPSHVVIMAGFAVLLIGGTAVHIQPHQPQWFVWPHFWVQLFLVQAWGLLNGDGWNRPTWSLSALLICYALFPLMWRTLKRAGSAYAGLAAAVVVMLVCALVVRLTLHEELYDLSEFYGVFRALPLFLLGVALSRLVAAAPLRAAWTTWVLAAAVASLIGLQVVARNDLASMGLIALALYAGGSAAVGRPSALVKTGARISFSLFITHAFALTLWAAAAHLLIGRGYAFPLQWPFWFGGIAFALALAFVFDRFVDQPMQARIKAALGRPGRLDRADKSKSDVVTAY